MCFDKMPDFKEHDSFSKSPETSTRSFVFSWQQVGHWISEYILPPIIMEVVSMGPYKISFLYNGAIFHFHDYGRTGYPNTPRSSGPSSGNGVATPFVLHLSSWTPAFGMGFGELWCSRCDIVIVFEMCDMMCFFLKTLPTFHERG